MTKTICNITLEFDDKFAAHYLKINGDSLSDMAEYYICAHEKKSGHYQSYCR